MGLLMLVDRIRSILPFWWNCARDIVTAIKSSTGSGVAVITGVDFIELNGYPFESAQ